MLLDGDESDQRRMLLLKAGDFAPDQRQGVASRGLDGPRGIGDAERDGVADEVEPIAVAGFLTAEVDLVAER
jgi:hypothetical protein